MSNAILPETEQIWKKIHEMWKFLKRTISEQESHQMWKFLKRKITEKKSHQIWWFLKMTNLKTFHHIKCESSWIGTFLKRNRIIYDTVVLGKGKKSLRHAMSICRYVDMSICRYVDMSICRYVDMSICRCDSMWWQPLFGISGAWSAFFSPQSSRRSALDTERNAIGTPEFIIVHHSSSRIQELSPDHVPCYGHTGHTHYVSFFTGPSWWRYWETSRMLCMMLSTLKSRIVIGDHDPILLEKTHLFATTTY